MTPIIEVRNLSKAYQIGADRQRYLSLRDSLVQLMRSGRRRREKFWALKDLSFDIFPGDSVGIIGRNGAGKSTLLKILSRITPPTEGRVTIRGRLASLLEVGTGFHPELTGRENIYLNGAILGLRKKEIDRKFDAIVDFSGVSHFLDTPLKHFSSGMQLRLAFSVAAHLEPEILVIDEVLAVGDAEFQRRCLGKMNEVSKSGRTVLFVSHNLGVVENLCNKGLLLTEGQLSFAGSSKAVVERYLQDSTPAMPSSTVRFAKGTKDKELHLRSVSVVNASGLSTNTLRFGEPFAVEVEVVAQRPVTGFGMVIGLNAGSGQRIFTAVSEQQDKVFAIPAGQPLTVRATFDNLVLHPGTYSLFLSIRKGRSIVFDTETIEQYLLIDPAPFDSKMIYEGHWGIIRYDPVWS